MSQAAPPQIITLSGTVYPTRLFRVAVGDVCIHPGANRTHYIDGYVYDGRAWRDLDLKSFGHAGKMLDGRGDIGSVMRRIHEVLVRHRGAPIYYVRIDRRSRYVFRGVSLPF
jgi:hypothetical protein